MFTVCIGFGMAPQVLIPCAPGAEIKGFARAFGPNGGNIMVILITFKFLTIL